MNSKYARRTAVLLTLFLALFGAYTAYAYTLTGSKFSNATFSYHDDPLSDYYEPQFQTGKNNWANSSPPTPLAFSYTTDSSSAEILVTGAYYGNTGYNAVTSVYSSGGISSKAEIKANYTYMDLCNETQRAATFAHELGHAFGLNHVSQTYYLMYGSLAGRTVYTPQDDDIAGVNYLY